MGPPLIYTMVLLLSCYLFSSVACRILVKRNSLACEGAGRIFAEIKYTFPLPEVAETSISQASGDSSLRTVEIADIRGGKIPNLETNGFTCVLDHKPDLHKSFEGLTEDQIKVILREDSLQLAKALTGAEVALPFADTFRRSKPGVPIKTYVHSDFTLDRLKDHYKLYQGVKGTDLDKYSNPEELEMFDQLVKAGKRVVIINVWRSVFDKVESHPLAVIDWKSVDVHTDRVNMKDYPGRGEGTQAWHHNDKQKFYYISNQTPGDIFAWISHDGYGSDEHGIHTPHTAFNDPSTKPGARGRYSYDVRVAVIVEDKFEPKISTS